MIQSSGIARMPYAMCSLQPLQIMMKSREDGRTRSLEHATIMANNRRNYPLWIAAKKSEDRCERKLPMSDSAIYHSLRKHSGSVAAITCLNSRLYVHFNAASFSVSGCFLYISIH